MRSWILRCVNWVASIWPQSNSIFLPTLVGLQTTKDPRELMRIEWESKRWSFLKITFNVVQNLRLLASNMIWSHLRSLQGVVSNGARLWILEFLNLKTVEIQTHFSDWKLSGFPLEWEGLNWGAKLRRKVCLKWAQRPCIYSIWDW